MFQEYYISFLKTLQHDVYITKNSKQNKGQEDDLHFVIMGIISWESEGQLTVPLSQNLAGIGGA